MTGSGQDGSEQLHPPTDRILSPLRDGEGKDGSIEEIGSPKADPEGP